MTEYKYEPIFNQVLEIVDSRGFSPEFSAPGGTAEPARYTTRFYYDYQESAGALGVEITDFAIPTSHLPGLFLGRDLNDDGKTTQQKGNCVRVENATVRLAPGGLEPPGAEQVVVTEQQWSDEGALVASINPVGVVTEYHYHRRSNPGGSPGSAPTGDNGGYLARKVVDAGHSPRRLASGMPDPLRLSTTYRYNAFGALVATVNPRGVETELVVNAAGETIQVIRDATGLRLSTTKRYDANGRLVETRSPDGLVITTLTYDILGALVQSRVTGPSMSPVTTQFRYDENGNQVLSTSPLGHQVKTEYDERNLAVAVTRGFESDTPSTARFAYDGNGNLVSAWDGLQRETRYEYDGHDRVRKITDPLGNETTLKYDPMGKVVQRTVTSPQAGELSSATIAYDELNRPYEVTERVFGSGRPPETLTIRTGYDAASRVVYSFDDGDVVRQVTTTRYDGASRPIETVDPVGNVTAVTYDPNGNPVATTSTEPSALLDVARSYRTQAVFDALDRLVRTIDPAGHTRELTYDSRSNVVLETDAEGTPFAGPDGMTLNTPGNSRSLVYDGLNRVIREVRHLRVGGAGAGAIDLTNPHNPDGEITITYAYDADSRLAAISDDRGQVTSFDYDALNRRTKTTLADGRTYTATYDAADNLRTTTDPNLTKISRDYDELNRLTLLTAVPGAGVVGTTRQEFEYDGLSRLTSTFDDNTGFNGGTGERCTWTYDSLGRVLTETQNGRTVTSTWSKDGRRESLHYPGGRQLRFDHDELDRVVSIVEGASELSRTDWIGPGYRLLKRKNANGSELRFVEPALREERGYDAAQRVTRLRWFQSTSITSQFVDREYTYNRASMRTSETRHDDGGRADRYGYDSAYRLARTSYGQESGPDREVDYTLDGVGNRHVVQADVAAVYSVNSLNQYTAINGAHRIHDANGNLIAEGARAYVYDAFDRLTWVMQDDRPIAHYTYFADGRRSRAEVWDPATQALARDTRFFYDGAQEIEELSAGTVVASYVWGPEYVDSLVQVTLGGTSYFAHQDARFNVVALTFGMPGATATLAERRRFDDFGRMEVVGGGPGVGLAYGFHGRRHDAETGLCYFRARYYDPVTGRFMTRDPVSDPTNLGNQYAFAANNPTSMVDPSGMWVEDLAFAIPSILMGAKSLGTNLGRGDFGWAALDALGLVVDIVALLTPGIPGGAGTAIQGVRVIRAADTAVDGWRVASMTFQAGGMAMHAGLEAEEAGLFGAGYEFDEEEEFDNCFLAGTLVVAGHQRSDGQVERVLREVQEVKADDLVLAQDPVTGEVGYRRVVRTFENVATSVVSVTVGAPECLPLRQAGRSERHAVGRTGSGEEGGEDAEPPSASQTIRCTPGHPWRVRGTDGVLRWVFAGDLRVGDRLVPESGPEQAVLALDVRAEVARTFNFEVEGWHTYYVAGPQGQPGVLVHNTSLAILKSIRRKSERIVKMGRTAEGRQALRRQGFSSEVTYRARRANYWMDQGNAGAAGTHFHSLNFHFVGKAPQCRWTSRRGCRWSMGPVHRQEPLSVPRGPAVVDRRSGSQWMAWSDGVSSDRRDEVAG